MKRNALQKLGWVLIPFLLSSCDKLGVLNSHGPVGQEESFLIKISLLLMLIVVVPVFVMLILIATRYRASNKKATYKPKWGHSNTIEVFVWGVPVLIIIILSYLTFVKTKELDPYKELESENKTVRVEVISTDWNWLFIYPEYNIAVVNELVIPEKTPVSFRLTSASVMTSFFIPQLGSQIYAMAGMETKLNLMANHTNEYTGQNQEYSGHGYSKMRFKTHSTTLEDFDAWVKEVKAGSEKLTQQVFDSLKVPHADHPVTYYSAVRPDLFDDLMGEFMDWMNDSEHHKMHMNHKKTNDNNTDDHEHMMHEEKDEMNHHEHHMEHHMHHNNHTMDNEKKEDE